MKLKLSILVTVICLLNLVPQLAAEESLEYKLASLDAGRLVPKDHYSVAKFRTLLSELDRTYVESKQEIADATVKAQEILEEDGIKESIMSIMEGMNSLFSKPLGNQKYQEYVAVYIVRRTQGESHSEALKDLKAILDVFEVK